MKKKTFFLITIFCMFFLCNKNVQAETTSFYEAEYIDGIYMTRSEYATGSRYYQKARFFRKTGTNEPAYCVQPFQAFKSNNNYTSTMTPDDLTQAQIEKISKLAHFGYGYKDHTDPKWYAITQLMIWKESSGDAGNFYFTNGLDGPYVDRFNDEMKEIENLIAEYDATISLNETYTIKTGEKLKIYIGKELENYITENRDITLNGEYIESSITTPGEYTINLVRNEETFNNPILFFSSPTSQTIVQRGNINNKTISFKLKVIETKINITKVDKDLKETTPQGEAQLDGATYYILNSRKVKVGEIIIKDGKGTLKDLDFGTYYIKEQTSGKGYLVDTDEYKIEITENSPQVDLILSNKVIEKEIKIIKLFGIDNDFQKEEGVEFQIKNKEQEVIKTLITDKNGEITTKLPYGEYTIEQVSSTDGYTMVEPIKIYVSSKFAEDETIELKDYKIPVPDTGIKNNKNSLFKILLSIIHLLILC